MLLKRRRVVVALVDACCSQDDRIHLDVIDLALVEVTGLRGVTKRRAPFGLQKNDVAQLVARHQVTRRPALVAQARCRELNAREDFHLASSQKETCNALLNRDTIVKAVMHSYLYRQIVFSPVIDNG